MAKQIYNESFSTVRKDLYQHTDSGDIHITAEDRSKWDAAAERPTVDLAGYAKSADVDTAIDTKIEKFGKDKNFISEIPSTYATDEEVEGKVKVLTGIANELEEKLGSYYNKDEVLELLSASSGTSKMFTDAEFDADTSTLTLTRANGAHVVIPIAGKSGESTTTRFVYTASDEKPMKPIGGKYDFQLSSFQLPNSEDGCAWTESRLLDGVVWMSSRTFSSNYKKNNTEWSEPMQITAKSETKEYTSVKSSHVEVVYHTGSQLLVGSDASTYRLESVPPATPVGGKYDSLRKLITEMPHSPESEDDKWESSVDYTRTFINWPLKDQDGSDDDEKYRMQQTWYFSIGTIGGDSDEFVWSEPAVYGVDHIEVASSMKFIAIDYSLLAENVKITANDILMAVADAVTLKINEDGLDYSQIITALSEDDDFISRTSSKVTIDQNGFALITSQVKSAFDKDMSDAIAGYTELFNSKIDGYSDSYDEFISAKTEFFENKLGSLSESFDAAQLQRSESFLAQLNSWKETFDARYGSDSELEERVSTAKLDAVDAIKAYEDIKSKYDALAGAFDSDSEEYKKLKDELDAAYQDAISKQNQWRTEVAEVESTLDLKKDLAETAKSELLTDKENTLKIIDEVSKKITEIEGKKSDVDGSIDSLNETIASALARSGDLQTVLANIKSDVVKTQNGIQTYAYKYLGIFAEKGDVIGYERDEDGNLKYDADGNPIPILAEEDGQYVELAKQAASLKTDYDNISGEVMKVLTGATSIGSLVKQEADSWTSQLVEYELDENGDVKYDENGNKVIKSVKGALSLEEIKNDLVGDLVVILAIADKANFNVKQTTFEGEVRATSLSVLFKDDYNTYIPRILFATNLHTESDGEEYRYIDVADDDTPVMVIYGSDGLSVEYVVPMNKWTFGTADVQYSTVSLFLNPKYNIGYTSEANFMDFPSTSMVRKSSSGTLYSSYDTLTATFNGAFTGTYWTIGKTNYNTLPQSNGKYYTRFYSFRDGVYYHYVGSQYPTRTVTEHTYSDGELINTTSFEVGVIHPAEKTWVIVPSSDILYDECKVGLSYESGGLNVNLLVYGDISLISDSDALSVIQEIYNGLYNTYYIQLDKLSALGYTKDSTEFYPNIIDLLDTTIHNSVDYGDGLDGLIYFIECVVLHCYKYRNYANDWTTERLNNIYMNIHEEKAGCTLNSILTQLYYLTTVDVGQIGSNLYIKTSYSPFTTVSAGALFGGTMYQLV